MHNFKSENSNSRGVELKEVLINKNNDPSSEIQNLANQWNMKFNQIFKYLSSLERKVPELEVRGSDDQFRKNIKDEITLCFTESKVLGQIYQRMAGIPVQSQSDKSLKEIHISQQRQQLEQFQSKFKIITDKYANIEQRHQKLNKFQGQRYEQGMEAEPTVERQRQRINEQKHEQELLDARAKDLQEILQNMTQAVSMIQDLDDKVAQQGIQISEMVTIVEDTKQHTSETVKIMEDTKKLTQTTTNTTLQLCLLITVIVIILILMVSGGSSKSNTTQPSNNTNNSARF